MKHNLFHNRRQVALTAMRVPDVVIRPLLQGIQRKGVFVLVDASGRVGEADSILDGNAGYIRTQCLRAPSA